MILASTVRPAGATGVRRRTAQRAPADLMRSISDPCDTGSPLRS
jgi:hypothetical protein